MKNTAETERKPAEVKAFVWVKMRKTEKFLKNLSDQFFRDGFRMASYKIYKYRCFACVAYQRKKNSQLFSTRTLAIIMVR
jgi:hypothetical protein